MNDPCQAKLLSSSQGCVHCGLCQRDEDDDVTRRDVEEHEPERDEIWEKDSAFLA